MHASENLALFGHDPDPRIVAVSFREPCTAVVYRRNGVGATTAEEIAFRPFLLDSEGCDGASRLEGGLDLRWLREFDSWRALNQARVARKDNTTLFLSDPIQQFLSITGKTLFKSMAFGDLRRLQIDIESTCSEGFGFSNSERDPLAAIALCDSSGWEEFLAVETGNPESERAALERLTAIIQERDPDVIEGHNLFKFDLPYLAARARRFKLKLAWGRDGSAPASRPSRLRIAEKAIQYTRFGIAGRHIVDTYLLALYYDVGTRELEAFGLKSVARHFGVAEQDRVVLEGGAIQRAYHEDPEAFRTYALQDVRETRALASVLCASYFIQAQIFPYNYQDVIVRGNATKIDALFLREYLRHSHSIPNCPEPEPFEGGYTDIFFTGVAHDVWHCDVASLYPSVMLRFNLLPQKDVLGVFGRMLADLRAFRLEAKARMRAAESTAERQNFSALQNTFKILINSFYGYLGFSQGHFADFEMAAAVTSRGRELLRSMVAWLEDKGARVIEIDTDGIYFQPPPGATPQSLDDGMRQILPDGIDVEFDRRYAAMFSYKAKNYALLETDGTLSIKGAALKSRGLERFLRDFLERMIRLILENKAGAVRDLRAEFERGIRTRAWPIEMLAKTEALQDSLASYRKKIAASSRNRSAAFELALGSGRPYEAGDQVSYYVTGTKKKVIAYEQAKLVEAWDPDNRDENVEYYVGKLDELARKFDAFSGADPQLDLL